MHVEVSSLHATGNWYVIHVSITWCGMQTTETPLRGYRVIEKNLTLQHVHDTK
jgi:hypothetical protein